MFHVWWPATAILTFLVMLTVLIILMYGDKICHRVKSQTETMITRMPRSVRRAEEQYRHQQPQPPMSQQQQFQRQQQQHQQQMQYQEQYHPQQPHQQQHHHEYQEEYQERGIGIEMHPPPPKSREVEV